MGLYLLAVCIDVNCGHDSCVRNTAVDGVTKVAAGQRSLNTYSSHVLEDMEEISPENLMWGGR